MEKKTAEQIRLKILEAKDEPQDEADWGSQYGILITVNQAKELLEASQLPVEGEPTIEEIRKVLHASHVKEETKNGIIVSWNFEQQAKDILELFRKHQTTM